MPLPITMLLPPRAVILNTIAVPAAWLVSALALSPAAASPGSEASHWRQGSGIAEPAVPRRALLIDLNPILNLEAPGSESSDFEFTPEPSTAGEQNSSAVPQVHPAHFGAMPMSERLAPSGGPWSSSPQQNPPRQSPTAGNPRPQRSTAPLNVLQRAQQAPQTWNAPFPSLGQPQLDRQLRRYLAYLDSVGQPDIVIVGGQGAAQGVDPLALQAALGDRGYSNLKVFNWGLSQSSAQTVEWLLTELLTPEQLPKLVIWAEASPALNGDRPDTAFARIQASPGQQLLAQGLRPQIAAAEQPFARRLGQILSNPAQPTLPAAVVELARSLQGPSRSAAANQFPVNASLSQSQRTKQNGKAKSKADSQLTPKTAGATPTTLAQATPILIDDRSQVLPILRPQAPVRPAASPAGSLINPGLGRPSLGDRNSPGQSNTQSNTQSSASGFRLVNWCRQTNGPCQSGHDNGSSAIDQAAPAWLRQTQAAQEQLKRKNMPQPLSAPNPAALPATSLTARSSQTSVTAPAITPLTLPTWSRGQTAERFLQAIGFQSIDQRLAPGSASPLNARNLTRTFSLQGNQNRALHRLAQFGQQQGLAIAIVPLPLSQQYSNRDRYRQEQSFRTYLSVAAQMTPLNLIELPGKAVVWQDALFAQPDRLNRYGAAVLGWQIGQSMEQQLLKKLH